MIRCHCGINNEPYMYLCTVYVLFIESSSCPPPDCVGTLHSTTRMMRSCSSRSWEATTSLTLPTGTISPPQPKISSSTSWRLTLRIDTLVAKPLSTLGEQADHEARDTNGSAPLLGHVLLCLECACAARYMFVCLSVCLLSVCVDCYMYSFSMIIEARISIGF